MWLSSTSSVTGLPLVLVLLAISSVMLSRRHVHSLLQGEVGLFQESATCAIFQNATHRLSASVSNLALPHKSVMYYDQWSHQVVIPGVEDMSLPGDVFAWCTVVILSTLLLSSESCCIFPAPVLTTWSKELTLPHHFSHWFLWQSYTSQNAISISSSSPERSGG